MTVAAAFANAAWLASSLPEWRRFRNASSKIEETQRGILATYLARAAGTEFGKQHGFSGIGCWEDYAENVPARSYDDFVPWIEKIKAGDQRVLTDDRVILLEPSSGSSGPEKLVPYTRTLQDEFRRAVATWIAQLFLEQWRLMGGHAYWSLTPKFADEATCESAVPVGFDEDTSYLGGVAQRLIGTTLATRPALRQIGSMDTFWHATLLLLLNCRDLRLISVWHPSYVSILLDQLVERWPDLMHDLEHGYRLGEPELDIAANPTAAGELSAIGPADPARIWPNLGLISCWGDAHAAAHIDHVRAAFPAARVQPKGLVATEAFVTLPFGDAHPLAVRSHFFEFEDDNGYVHPAWGLESGRTYAVIVTTGGGLYRYRLRDRVQVEGYFGEVPDLRFLGKEDIVSDHFGEKLSEPFVASVLRALFERFPVAPRFAMLALDDPLRCACYSLFIECDLTLPVTMESALEDELRRNPHYELCVRLGQLNAVRIRRIDGGFDKFSKRMMDAGMRLGDIKPVALSRLGHWSGYFVEKSV